MEIPSVPGFGFHPIDDDILGYLKQRVLEHIEGRPNSMTSFFPDIDLSQIKPWDIPHHIESSTMGNPNRDKWYFFSLRREKRNGTVDRTVPETGYWNVTGRTRDVVSSVISRRTVIGKKSILVLRRSGRGTSSIGYGSWTIHEYQLTPSYLAHHNHHMDQMPYVACCLMRGGEGS